MISTDRPNCPKCNSAKVAQIIYGIPEVINSDAEARGEFVQAGCCIIIGKSPEWQCVTCGNKFGVSEGDTSSESSVILPLSPNDVTPRSLAEHMAQNSTFGVIMKALAEFEALPPSQKLKLEQERWERTAFMRRSSLTTPEQGQE